MVNFLLEGEVFGCNSGQDTGPECGENGTEGGRGRGVSEKVAFQARVEMRVMDECSQACVEFSR